MSEAKAPTLADIRAGRRPPSKRTLAREQSRQRLLDAARDLFRDKGYIQTKVEDIAAAAGVSRPTFYLHFENKFGALYALVDADIKFNLESYAHLDEILDAGDRAAFRRWIAKTLDESKGRGAFAPILDEVMRVEPNFPRWVHQIRMMATDKLPRYVKRSTDGHTAASIRIDLFVSSLESITRACFLENTWNVDEAIDALVDLWYPALRR